MLVCIIKMKFAKLSNTYNIISVQLDFVQVVSVRRVQQKFKWCMALFYCICISLE